ncbi:fungal-specific transcription factor domain-containing protein [Hygrophoropsis aurantiaca]|uniref:Fungal-specific transcription factor domain-containing protein n=1 Tax=Hygrophoropsis aurantiaca TaxID=72124 RepID=A0ACB8AAZ2_9AGAM|nr:fungal-specific transcription factor domain-containing protein [Hygrophoropsis aurantiaca]
MSSNHWNESDPSDEEANHDSLSTRKRSSRACDQCRKTKSKCEPSPSTNGTCKSCAVGGNACTFLGPSYKRGPPKGYIQAIEQRWHQVESLLGAIVACPDRRVQEIISEMQQDDLAREILNRVDTGPFGPSGRRSQPAGATKEDFFACIFRSNESSARDAARSRRQSRISREIVSSTRDNALATAPTMDWQDRLSARLTHSRGNPSNSRSSNVPSSSPTHDPTGAPFSQRRRYNIPSEPGTSQEQPNWGQMYTLDASSESEDTDDSGGPSAAFGQLSLDENQEVRYHGKASGLHLLGRSDRFDSRHEGGIWRLPMARFWPPAKTYLPHLLPEESSAIELPSIEVQDHLIDLYFEHVHVIFPVIHKTRFLREYNSRKYGSHPTTPESGEGSSSSPNQEPSQSVTKLLLLAIFSIAARYSDDATPPTADRMWEAGCQYLVEARTVLAKVYHSSRASTCQALLLLGHREFGIGSMEQGWLYIGMAIRMAQDLGLNRAADKWQFNGAPMFSPEENQVRKQIWWACCVADKYTCIYMGRPVCIGEHDFDTMLPDVDEDENDSWSPSSSDATNQYIPPPIPRIMSCFRASASLSVIVGAIITMIYPVRPGGRVSRKSLLNTLEARLDQWYINLPDGLRYDPASRRNIPSPPVLFMHMNYWSAVLLLHRAFIPNWKGSDQVPKSPSAGSDTTSLKAFDLCQSAATYISTIATTYHENFSLKRSSPFLSSYTLSAGIMHIVTLALRPSNVQAYIGLRQCLIALKEMETIWPSAARAWDLLNGVKVQVDGNITPLVPGPDRQKRGADDAFGREKSSDVLQREAFGVLERKDHSTQNTNGVQDISTRMMAHMLGLDIPGIEPSTSYYPGYEWWPRTANQSGPQSYIPPAIGSTSSTDSLMSLNYASQNNADWSANNGPANYSYDFSAPPGHYRM